MLINIKKNNKKTQQSIGGALKNEQAYVEFDYRNDKRTSLFIRHGRR
ncbi:hypothetical protein GCM10027342_47780 [Photobacterium alginatilyticum]